MHLKTLVAVAACMLTFSEIADCAAEGEWVSSLTSAPLGNNYQVIDLQGGELYGICHAYTGISGAGQEHVDGGSYLYLSSDGYGEVVECTQDDTGMYYKRTFTWQGEGYPTSHSCGGGFRANYVNSGGTEWHLFGTERAFSRSRAHADLTLRDGLEIRQTFAGKVDKIDQTENGTYSTGGGVLVASTPLTFTTTVGLSVVPGNKNTYYEEKCGPNALSGLLTTTVSPHSWEVRIHRMKTRVELERDGSWARSQCVLDFDHLDKN